MAKRKSEVRNQKTEARGPKPEGIHDVRKPELNEPSEDREPALSSDLHPASSGKLPKFFTATIGAVVFLILLFGGFSVVYAGKVYPGVSADGVYLGGLSREQAKAALKTRVEEYKGELIPINYGDTTLRISPSKLDLSYDIDRVIEDAYRYGREGGWLDRLRAKGRTMVSRTTNITAFNFSDDKLAPYLSQVGEDVTERVENAKLEFASDTVVIAPAKTGKRLELGRFVMAIKDRLATTSNEAVDAPVYDLPPQVTPDDLGPIKEQAQIYVAGPLELKFGNQTATVKPDQIVSWFKLTRELPRDFNQSNNIVDFTPTQKPVELSLNDEVIKNYVATLAKKIDQPGQDAALTITDGKATVFRPSKSGAALDQPKALTQIKDALAKAGDERKLTLDVTISKPSVTEDKLNDLGINELIGSGFSTFPGSSSARLTNIRVGAKLYNGVLLKPDQVFSFGEILGDVGPEQGYQPSLVIIGTKEEKQYGGGLCQVSSTAFRAALNAGLPILERTNHAFAVSFYTQPYGIPGVDATIYYPQVDFKFKNDTGHYILIQTIMEGTTLKFDFYGTKVKSGNVRGPFFVTGTLDDTKPSHTVFYRDVLDLNGNVTKTDTFHTYYKASTDFTIVDQPQLH